MPTMYYLTHHNSLTPWQMISAIAVGAILGIIIFYFLDKKTY
jgi:membrane protein DedA with SNARE-associated domain